MKDDALIEATKELAMAFDALTVTLERLRPRKHYPCIVCGRKGVPGVLQSEGFTCNDCFEGSVVAGNDLFAYTCGTCGEKGKGGVDFGVGGFICDECINRSQSSRMPIIKIGKYNISEMSEHEDSVLIEDTETGEGGQFRKELIFRFLEKFYCKYF